MEELLRKRTGIRGWLTRSVNALKALVDEQNPSLREFHGAIEDFKKRLAALDAVQAEVDIAIDPSALEADQSEADLFRRDCQRCKFIAVDALENLIQQQAATQSGQGDIAFQAGLQPSDQGETASQVASQLQNPIKVKYPELKLPQFSGDVTDWPEFWETFEVYVDSKEEFPDLIKFGYLCGMLGDEASKVISSLQKTAANYQVAKDLLKKRYERPARIKYCHVKALMNIEIPKIVKGNMELVKDMWRFQDKLLKHIRGLETMGVQRDHCELFLVPIIVDRLPEELRDNWAKEGEGFEDNLEYLLHFISKEIERLERRETVRSEETKKKNSLEVKKESHSSPNSSKFSKHKSTTSALHVSAAKPICNFCSKAHESENCYKILRMTGAERGHAIQRAGLCFRCLSSEHYSSGCSEKCRKCKGPHNVLMCGVRIPSLSKASEHHRSPDKKEEQPTSAENATTAAVSEDSKVTVLQTALVTLDCGNGRTVAARVMFDNGAGRSYATSKTIKRCNGKYITKKRLPFSAFGGTSSDPKEDRNVYNITLYDSKKNKISINVAEISTICQPLHRPRVPVEELNQFTHLDLADNYMEACNMEIDLLIGLDYYWSFIEAASAVKGKNLVAMKCPFGWTLSGAVECFGSVDQSTPQFLCVTSVSDRDLHKLWDLESVGVMPKEQKRIDLDPVILEFQEKVKFSDDRYEVCLPWKSDSDRQRLQNNEKQVLKCLMSLEKKLDKDLDMKKAYKKVFDEYEKEGIIESVPLCETNSDPVFYIPHHLVLKLDIWSTKLRPVFNASFKGYNDVSLNDCLHAGPPLNADLVEVLLRFRRWPFAIRADVTKAFLQISVNPIDRDVLRFMLVDDDGTVRRMRFARVPFGVTSSPFLLTATIHHHLSKYPNTEIITELTQDMYTDNWLSGANSSEEASAKYMEARQILSEANMPLTKLLSNSQSMITQFSSDLYPQQGEKPNTVLGLYWHTVPDIFVFEGINLKLNVDLECTKRMLLSLIARMYDPCGYLSPFIMYGKILLQEIWKLGLSWDEALPIELERKVISFIESSQLLKEFKINRTYFKDLPWDTKNVDLHVFGDASEKGYGSCVYIRTKNSDGTYDVSLVISKSRVTPLKRIVLPRLELLAALISSRLVIFVLNALHLQGCNITCWTDSMTTLAWIRGDPNNWKTFVANRVFEIQSLTPPSVWRHCSGIDNPSDIVSRGVLADKLIGNREWLHGPSWLSLPINTEERTVFTTTEEMKSQTENLVAVSSEGEIPSIVVNIERWNSYTKAQRVFAWVLRFINNCRKSTQNRRYECLKNEELQAAENKLVHVIQKDAFSNEIKSLQEKGTVAQSSRIHKLNPFLDSEGMLRIKGRLEYSSLSYENKHPLILPSCHLVKLLVRKEHLRMHHAGVNTLIASLRSSYWILGLRRIVKSVVKGCVQCRRHDSRPCSETAAPLPEQRVTPAPPFTVTGIDYAGPVYCVDYPGQKFYMLLFTCAVVRCVHIELTNSLSVDDFMLAIRKFICRRGTPNEIFSDNAKTFKAASQKLNQMLGPNSPKWHFIAAVSPWWGGFWERLIRSIKLALRKSLGVKSITRKELEATLVEIEAVVNSRPLVFKGDQPTDINSYLTPSHFLVYRNLSSKNENQVTTTDISPQALYEHTAFFGKILE